MPRENETSTGGMMAAILRRGKISSVDRANDACDLEILDDQGAGTGETYEDVPIFYHCFPDVAVRANGALEAGASAFAEDDIVIVKFHGAAPKVVGFIEGPKPCWRVGIFRLSNTFYIASILQIPQENVQWSYGASIPGYIFWNWRASELTGDDCWFIQLEYWRCEGGVVYKGRANSNGQKQVSEVACTGINYVRSLQVRQESGQYHMVYEEDQNPNDWGVAARVWSATSPDGIAWTRGSIRSPGNYCDEQVLIHDAHETMGGEWFEETDTYFIEPCNVGIADQNGFMHQYTERIVRIGREDYFTNGGINTTYEGYSMVGKKGEVTDGYGFTREAAMEIQGQSLSSGAIQIVQIIKGG